MGKWDEICLCSFHCALLSCFSCRDVRVASVNAKPRNFMAARGGLFTINHLGEKIIEALRRNARIDPTLHAMKRRIAPDRS